MKKTYISPSTTCMRTSTEEMLCQSIPTETTDEEVIADSREVLFDKGGSGSDVWDEW